MDPNSNQPDGQQPATPPISPTTPDWQQGLGNAAPQPPAPAGSVNPATPGARLNQPPDGQPGSMPAGQPGNWAQPGTPPAAPDTGPSLPPVGGPDPMMATPPKKKIPQLFIVAGVVVVVLVIVAATYFLFLKGSGSSTDAAKKSSAASSGSDMSKLAHVTLNLPETIAGYTSRNTGVETIKDFISEDGNCEFIAGTVTAAQLPGADLNAIVDPQLKTLRDGGATVKGPNAGNALLLKEKGGSKTYAMPTLNFEFSQDKKHAAVHYSAVILSSTDRAVINRTCVNKDGAIDAAKLTALDSVAKGVTVTVKQ